MENLIIQIKDWLAKESSAGPTGIAGWLPAQVSGWVSPRAWVLWWAQRHVGLIEDRAFRGVANDQRPLYSLDLVLSMCCYLLYLFNAFDKELYHKFLRENEPELQLLFLLSDVDFQKEIYPKITERIQRFASFHNFRPENWDEFYHWSTTVTYDYKVFFQEKITNFIRNHQCRRLQLTQTNISDRIGHPAGVCFALALGFLCSAFNEFFQGAAGNVPNPNFLNIQTFMENVRGNPRINPSFDLYIAEIQKTQNQGVLPEDIIGVACLNTSFKFLARQRILPGKHFLDLFINFLKSILIPNSGSRVRYDADNRVGHAISFVCVNTRVLFFDSCLGLYDFSLSEDLFRKFSQERNQTLRGFIRSLLEKKSPQHPPKRQQIFEDANFLKFMFCYLFRSYFAGITPFKEHETFPHNHYNLYVNTMKVAPWAVNSFLPGPVI